MIGQPKGRSLLVILLIIAVDLKPVRIKSLFSEEFDRRFLRWLVFILIDNELSEIHQRKLVRKACENADKTQI